MKPRNEDYEIHPGAAAWGDGVSRFIWEERTNTESADTLRQTMIESLVKHLAQYAKLENSIDVERFEATLSQIGGLKDPRCIGLLIPFFNDQCKFHEVMFSIVHTIEMFDDETYVREILKALPTFWKQSPYWANTIHFGIFNSPSIREVYRRQLAKADATIKAAAKDLLTTMREKEPKFVQACDQMLAVL